MKTGFIFGLLTALAVSVPVMLAIIWPSFPVAWCFCPGFFLVSRFANFLKENQNDE
jgi:hypothetical protein